MRLRLNRLIRPASIAVWLACCSIAPNLGQAAQEACATNTPAASADLSIAGLEGLFDTLEGLDAHKADCVVLIETEDAPDIRENIRKPGGLWKVRRLVARMTALSGANCYLFHYSQLKRDTFASRPQVKALVLKAWKIPRLSKEREELHALIRETPVPMIGFCGGFHQIYYAHGGNGGPLRNLRSDEKDPNPKYNPGIYKEWGPTKIRITRRDPILDGFDDALTLHEMHAFQCTSLPAEFVNLAETDECRIQIIKHREKALYGTQAHPEVYDDHFQDGKKLLLNFFKIAGLNGNISR